MSRIGKKIITIPSSVKVEKLAHEIKITGPKGTLTQAIHPRVNIEQTSEGLVVTVPQEDNKKDRALWGTFGSLLKNMVVGVTDGYKKQLQIEGVGYKVVLKGNDLNLEVGFSHPVVFAAPTGIKFSVEKNVITVEGFDKQLVGETAAQLRAVKKPEPYKGKGIRYTTEVVRRKAGKTGAKAA